MSDIASEGLRVIKPGGHALVWSIPRTSHWTAMAWENAGWETREKIIYIFGQGFPKSLDISKKIDEMAGVKREVVGTATGMGKQNPEWNGTARGRKENSFKPEYNLTIPATDAAKQWNGFGTALKPAHEDWLLFRKPVEGTIAQNVLKYETGGLNIDKCRVETIRDRTEYGLKNSMRSQVNTYGEQKGSANFDSTKGRWPANLIIDDSPEVLALFPNTKSGKMMPTPIEQGYQKNCYGKRMEHMTMETYGDSGSAARFFYCAKASPSERNMGCENLPQRTPGECTDRVDGSAGLNSPRAGAGRTNGAKNDHPTVKSLALMKYLCRLITPPGGIILDPFCGSGSTGVAAKIEGFDCIMIDSDEHSCEIAKARCGVKYK